MITELEKFGLSEKEAKVYLAALELGTESANNIAKKAGVNRATTYFILESLVKLGLASSYEKEKKMYYSAEAPNQLNRLLKKKEDEIEEKKNELKKFIPELEAIFNLSAGKPKVKFYEGIEGIRSMYQEALKQKLTEIFSFTPLDKYLETFPEQSSVKDRVTKKWKLKVVYTHQNGPVKNATDKNKLRIARFVPKNKFPFESMIDIFPSYGIRVYNFKPNFSGITIEDKQTAKTLKAVFDLVWEAAEKYN